MSGSLVSKVLAECVGAGRNGELAGVREGGILAK